MNFVSFPKLDLREFGGHVIFTFYLSVFHRTPWKQTVCRSCWSRCGAPYNKVGLSRKGLWGILITAAQQQGYWKRRQWCDEGKDFCVWSSLGWHLCTLPKFISGLPKFSTMKLEFIFGTEVIMHRCFLILVICVYKML